jgi:trypsin-like peptidase
VTTTQRDQAVPARVIVRVIDGAGEPVGAGFVIGPDLVATCAHVVAAAVRGDPYSATPPARTVELDLPLLLEPGADGPTRVSAEIARWIPITPEGTGDIAVLRVRDPLPDGARMPPLRRVDQLWDHTFRVLGFPAGMADGVWATGRFRGLQGTRWFQMQGSAGEQPIVEGFSGSPVWDETSGADRGGRRDGPLHARPRRGAGDRRRHVDVRSRRRRGLRRDPAVPDGSHRTTVG